MKTSPLWAVAVVSILAGGAVSQEEPSKVPSTRSEAEEQFLKQKYAPYPAPEPEYVTDLADLLSPEDEDAIKGKLRQVRRKSGVEMRIVTIGSIKDYPGTANSSIEPFARGLFDKYEIGKMPKNDGVLLLVAKNDRKARIELGAGYGRTRDADATRIMERVIVPQFKKERYARGVTDGVDALAAEFGGVRDGSNRSLIYLVIAILVLGLVAYSLFRSGKRGWGWVCTGIVVILFLAVLQIIQKTLRTVFESSHDSWGTGGYGGGFGGGGGGGFGGGFSGGGGATGSW